MKQAGLRSRAGNGTVPTQAFIDISIHFDVWKHVHALLSSQEFLLAVNVSTLTRCTCTQPRVASSSLPDPVRFVIRNALEDLPARCMETLHNVRRSESRIPDRRIPNPASTTVRLTEVASLRKRASSVARRRRSSSLDRRSASPAWRCAPDDLHIEPWTARRAKTRHKPEPDG